MWIELVRGAAYLRTGLPRRILRGRSRSIGWCAGLVGMLVAGAVVAAASAGGDGERPFAGFGEQARPAAGAPAGTPMVPRDDDTVYQLSNYRIERGGATPWPRLALDYQVVHSGKYAGQSLVVRRADGRTQIWLLLGPMSQERGKLEIPLRPGGPRDAGPPRDAECYLTRQDMRYPSHPTFKVSNSAVMGEMKQITRPRAWTEQETRMLAAPPPDYANAYPGVGHDTEWAGKSGGALTSRFVSPGNPLLGIEYRPGRWQREACLAQLVPVFDRNQPVTLRSREVAKAGYAAAG